jgi:hypothetical protein
VDIQQRARGKKTEKQAEECSEQQKETVGHDEDSLSLDGWSPPVAPVVPRLRNPINPGSNAAIKGDRARLHQLFNEGPCRIGGHLRIAMDQRAVV